MKIGVHSKTLLGTNMSPFQSHLWRWRSFSRLVEYVRFQEGGKLIINSPSLKVAEPFFGESASAKWEFTQPPKAPNKATHQNAIRLPTEDKEELVNGTPVSSYKTLGRNQRPKAVDSRRVFLCRPYELKPRELRCNKKQLFSLITRSFESSTEQDK